jgi:hypothetical protein
MRKDNGYYASSRTPEWWIRNSFCGKNMAGGKCFCGYTTGRFTGSDYPFGMPGTQLNQLIQTGSSQTILKRSVQKTF